MDCLSELFAKIDITLDSAAHTRFDKYYEYLIEYNKIHNLTAITEYDDVIKKHFLDSVLPHKLIKKNATLIDIGSGAGFPSMPLKIVREDINVTMVDSLNKRINFLNQLIKLLDVNNITAEHSRAEDLPISYREHFDVATARAVADLKVLCEYCLPFVAIGGIMIAYKSENAEDEVRDAERAISILGAKVKGIVKLPLVGTDIVRSFVIIEKVKSTNKKYPRGGNKPRISPLK